MRMKKKFLIGIFILGVLLLLGRKNSDIYAATEGVKQLFEPYVISTGTEEDIQKASYYDFTSDGKTFVPLTVTKDSSLVINMQVKNPDYVIVEMYRDMKGGSLPDYFPCKCTIENGRKGNITIYLTKGTYYFKFPENSYTIRALLFSNEDKTLRESDLVSSYCDHLHPVIYHFQPKQDGYVMVSQKSMENTNSSMISVLCDSKGNELTNIHIFDMLHPKELMYVVKKNKSYSIKTYALDVNGMNYSQIKTKFYGKKDEGGKSKKKASTLKFGKKGSGLVLAEDSDSATDWFVVSIPKKQKVRLCYTAHINSGNLKIDIYDAKGNILKKDFIIQENDKEGEWEVLNKKGTSKLPKGNYYVKVTKMGERTAGFYTVKLTGYE